jgi:hypothetical protein
MQAVRLKKEGRPTRGASFFWASVTNRPVTVLNYLQSAEPSVQA